MRETVHWQQKLSATSNSLRIHGFSGSSCACVKLTAVFLGGGAVKCGTLEIAWCCHILCGPRLCPLAVGWDFDSNTGGSSEESWREGECMTRPRTEINTRNETWQSYLGRGQERTLQSFLAYIVCLGIMGMGWEGMVGRQFANWAFIGKPVSL